MNVIILYKDVLYNFLVLFESPGIFCHFDTEKLTLHQTSSLYENTSYFGKNIIQLCLLF